jgi:glycosidase
MSKSQIVRRTRHRAACIALGCLAMGAFASGASAKSGAVCTFSDGGLRCVGTIADQMLGLGDTPASFVMDGNRAQLSMTMRPLLRLLDDGEQLEFSLGCTPAGPTVTCSGSGVVDGQSVAVKTSGPVDGSSALIHFSTGAGWPSGASATATKAGPSSVRDRSHRTVHHRRRQHRHHHHQH